MRKLLSNPWILPCLVAVAASPYPAAQDAAPWVPAHGLTAYFQLNFLKIHQGTLYAVDQSRSENRWLRRSDDLGDTWIQVGPPIPIKEHLGAMEIIGSQIFLLCRGEGVWRLSSPEDTAWMPVNDGLRNLDSLNHMALGGSTLLLAAEYGFFSWSAGDDRWIPAGEALPDSLGMRSITEVGSTLYATDPYQYLYRGVPGGTGWTWSRLPLQGLNSIVRKGGYLFATGPTGGNFKHAVYRSGDDGITWLKKSAGLPTSENTTGGPVPLAMVGDNLFVSFHDEGIVYRSADDGETWIPYAGRPENRMVYIVVLAAYGGELLAMSEDGLYRLSTGFSSVRPQAGPGGSRLRLLAGSRSFQYRFDAPGWARLGLFTTTGRSALPVFQGFQTGETRVFPLAHRVQPGSYLLRVETRRGSASHLLRID